MATNTKTSQDITTQSANKTQLQNLDKISAGLDYFAGKLSSKEYEKILISDDFDE